jgi:glycine oxidase
MNRHGTDILIVGGGIMGLLSAFELLQHGVRVRILERQDTGREASWAGGGILSPLYPWRVSEAINRLFAWSHQQYPRWIEAIRAQGGLDPEWIRSGLLVADGVAERESVQRWAATWGFTPQWLDNRTTREREPAANWPDGETLCLPDIAQVRNPRLLAAVRQAVSRRGGILTEHTPVTRFRHQRSTITGVETPRAVYTADQYVLAAGAWSGQLITTLTGNAQALPVEPVKGQMLIFKTTPHTLRHILLSEGHYLIPRQDGRILAGSTLEYTGFEQSTTEAARQQLLAFARHWLPDIPITIEKHWAGLRPGSPEGVPCIDRHPAFNNLYLNCGHFRNGFVMAPASARLLTDLILQRPPFTDPAPYRLERFANPT